VIYIRGLANRRLLGTEAAGEGIPRDPRPLMRFLVAGPARRLVFWARLRLKLGAEVLEFPWWCRREGVLWRVGTRGRGHATRDVVRHQRDRANGPQSGAVTL